MTPPTDADKVSRAATDRGQKTRQKFTPEEARQGQIVLKGPRQRRIFFAGLIGAIILALVVGLALV